MFAYNTHVRKKTFDLFTDYCHSKQISNRMKCYIWNWHLFWHSKWVFTFNLHRKGLATPIYVNCLWLSFKVFHINHINHINHLNHLNHLMAFKVDNKTWSLILTFFHRAIGVSEKYSGLVHHYWSTYMCLINVFSLGHQHASLIIIQNKSTVDGVLNFPRSLVQIAYTGWPDLYYIFTTCITALL